MLPCRLDLAQGNLDPDDSTESTERNTLHGTGVPGIAAPPFRKSSQSQDPAPLLDTFSGCIGASKSG
jgi:hypothetical protein